MIKRKEQKKENIWRLDKMFSSISEWKSELEKIKKEIPDLLRFRGRLKEGSHVLLEALQNIEKVSQEAESLATYAFLSYSVDSANPEVQSIKIQADNMITSFSTNLSYFDPELMSLDTKTVLEDIEKDEFAPYRVYLKKTLRMKEHTLSEKEENLLARYTLVSSTWYDTFNILNNVDLHFEPVDGKELTHATYQSFMLSDDESIREKAYRHYYKAFKDHAHTLSQIYSGSVFGDIFASQSRGYPSSLSHALFPDDVPESVYTSLIEAVHDGFPVLHRYYRLRAKLLNKKKLQHWDMYVPMVRLDRTEKHTYEEAVSLIKDAVRPLGDDYQRTLISGLTHDGWVDRYENEGKRSGAFSSGCYTSMPYIMTNFNDEVLSSVFTLIHEGGHSMHSYYSKKNNPYFSSEYTIFEAEVASTFNEQLLQNYLLEHASDSKKAAFLIGKHLDDIVATLFRQTMFAEFEYLIHKDAEGGIPVTLERIRSVYRNLLVSYFGPDVEFIEESDLESLRIPHFYTAFYTYKYATGISAAIALSEKVLHGNEESRKAYLSFLSSGGSSYPIESLKKAGVDMSTKKPVEEAIKHFATLLEKLEKLTS